MSTKVRYRCGGRWILAGGTGAFSEFKKSISVQVMTFARNKTTKTTGSVEDFVFDPGKKSQRTDLAG